MNSFRAVLTSARIRALLSLGMVLGLGAVGTLAAWSTETKTTSGVFTTASIDIQLNGNQGNPVAYPVSFATPLSLLPGQSVSALLPVQNRGSVAFTYSATAVGIDTLGQALQLTAKTGATVVNNLCNGGTTTTATPVLTTPQTFRGGTGSVAATTGSETLCLQFTLPTDVSNTLQGASGNVSLVFTATSV